MRARILALNVPRLLLEVIGGVVEDYASLELLGRETQDVLGAIEAVQPDVVILVSDRGHPNEQIALIRASYPALRIVCLDSGGGVATFYEAGAAPREIAEVSPTMLLSLLRGSS